MVAVIDAHPSGEVAQSAVAWLGDSPGVDASIASYHAAGERMLAVVNVTWKICVGLFVLILVAWVWGVLPVAIKLF